MFSKLYLLLLLILYSVPIVSQSHSRQEIFCTFWSTVIFNKKCSYLFPLGCLSLIPGKLCDLSRGCSVSGLEVRDGDTNECASLVTFRKLHVHTVMADLLIRNCSLQRSSLVQHCLLQIEIWSQGRKKISIFPVLTGHIKLLSVDLVNKCVLIPLGPGWLFGTANTIESKRETASKEPVNLTGVSQSPSEQKKPKMGPLWG